MTVHERRAKNYALVFAEEKGLDLEDSEFVMVVNGRMTRTHGKIKYRTPYEIHLSKHAIRNKSWSHMKGIIRHELAHLFANREHDETGEYGLKFREYLKKFDGIEKTRDQAREPRYILECQDCGAEVKRQRRSKVIKQWHRYNCGTCGGDLERTK